MCDEPQITFDKRVSIEFPDNEESMKLLALTPDARLDIVRKGFVYEERERRCMVESLNSEYAAQRAIWETEKIQLTRSHEIRIEQMQKTSQERINGLQRVQDDIKQAHEACGRKLIIVADIVEVSQCNLSEQLHEVIEAEALLRCR